MGGGTLLRPFLPLPRPQIFTLDATATPDAMDDALAVLAEVCDACLRGVAFSCVLKCERKCLCASVQVYVIAHHVGLYLRFATDSPMVRARAVVFLDIL